MHIPEIQAEVIAILEWFQERPPSGLPAERLAMSLDDARSGEEGVGLETFCENLNDFGVAVPQEMIERIAAVGRKMGLDERYWIRLRSM